MSCSDGFLDTGHDYALLWSPSDPTPGDGWTVCGAGRERHDKGTDEYVENIGRNVFYSYTFYH